MVLLRIFARDLRVESASGRRSGGDPRRRAPAPNSRTSVRPHARSADPPRSPAHGPWVAATSCVVGSLRGDRLDSGAREAVAARSRRRGRRHPRSRIESAPDGAGPGPLEPRRRRSSGARVGDALGARRALPPRSNRVACARRGRPPLRTPRRRPTTCPSPGGHAPRARRGHPSSELTHPPFVGTSPNVARSRDSNASARDVGTDRSPRASGPRSSCPRVGVRRERATSGGSPPTWPTSSRRSVRGPEAPRRATRRPTSGAGDARVDPSPSSSSPVPSCRTGGGRTVRARSGASTGTAAAPRAHGAVVPPGRVRAARSSRPESAWSPAPSVGDGRSCGSPRPSARTSPCSRGPDGHRRTRARPGDASH